ncbi:MAG: hypothetical protein H8D56_16090 [Planctomycetes bacterium]|nr:hypothetical protein [Planctomycetota bacterium]MBL7143249.1 hypothetical protein [Phycisphaerae bacterium]
MCKKLIYLVSFVLVLSAASRVQAEPFSLGAMEDITLGNDARYGPDSSSNGSGLEARNIPSRRHVVLISYDISELKNEGIFSNVSFTHFSHDLHGETNVYGVIESLDLLEVESLTWNTAPGVQNNPTPALDAPIELDFADLTDVLLTFSGPGQIGVRFSTDKSDALADFLNSDSDGVVTFLLSASAENNQLIVRSREHAEGGSFLEGEIGGFLEMARSPEPADGALLADTWVTLGWRPGDFAVSHDIYIGENFDDVDNGKGDTFQGNQTESFIVVGFPGFAFPDGLAPGTTYYWRIDEVNDTEPNSPWKGPVWSFSVPPKTAYFPEPADGAESVDLDGVLSWTAGYGSKLHTIYFGDNFDQAENTVEGITQGITTYNPGKLKMAKTYYWRVDEFDAAQTYKGDVWSFTTEGAVGNPSPTKGAVDVTQTPVLTWTTGFGASHEVYFGSDASSLELKGTGNLGSESFEPGQLEWNTMYYWRIDEANNANADSPWTGPLWSFTTANFLIIDDMESYNDINEGEPDSNRIYLAWLDGFDNPTINGSTVGHLDPPIAERTIIHSGNQSMPFAYDNTVGKSEATLTLTSNRDWTINGINTLTIWFRGNSDNASETLYVALNGNAAVNHDNPDAAQINKWTQWNIDLQIFADQSVNLANVNSITLGLGNRNNPIAGGSGMMYFDDIRLYRLP